VVSAAIVQIYCDLSTTRDSSSQISPNLGKAAVLGFIHGQNVLT
jgi:hypothetical protein